LGGACGSASSASSHRHSWQRRRSFGRARIAGRSNMRGQAWFGVNSLAATLPQEPGTYALVLRIAQDLILTVGKLGTANLPSGLYVYLGSAMGSGGVRARVARHFRDSRRIHWHIDTLTKVCSAEGVFWVIDSARLECAWAQSLLRLPGSGVPIPGFGSSDCSLGCPAHLVRIGEGYGYTHICNAIELHVEPP
jgi:Uri superfamily endonuclease